MASLPPFRQIAFTDIPGAPAWFSNFLSSLNQWLGAVYDTVNKGTTLGPNIPSQLATVTVSTDSAGTFAAPAFNATLQAPPVACLLAQCRLIRGTAGSAAISLNQWSLQAGKVQLTVVGMQPACTYQLTFLLL